MGCGHGLVSRALAPSFASVFALDPSAGMVEQAKKLTTDPKVTVRQGFSHEIAFLQDKSIDCVVAGQAAHWFDYDRTWPELARVTKPGGCVAFWGYKDQVILGYPSTTPIFNKFTYSKEEPTPGMESLGRFWERPGRDILHDSYAAIAPPDSDWHSIKRIAWDPHGEEGGIEEAPQDALWLRKSLKLGELESFFRTYSSYGAWKDAYPDSKSRAEGGEGDIIDKMWDEMVKSVPEWKAAGAMWRDIEVEVAWGTVILLARRR